MVELAAKARQGERDLVTLRDLTFQVASGLPPEHFAVKVRDKIAAEEAMLTQYEDEASLGEPSFNDVRMFYAGFALRMEKAERGLRKFS